MLAGMAQLFFSIIDPISSRCAKFRFNPFRPQAAIELLRDIAGKEGISVSDEVILLACNSAGRLSVYF